MRKWYLVQILLVLLIITSLNAVTYFEITNEDGDPVFVVDSLGVTIINYEPQSKGKALGDTLMTISSRSIKAYVNNNTGKGLSRSFSVTTSTSAGKGDMVDLLEITNETATMREGDAGNKYSDFSEVNIFLGLLAGASNTSGVGNTFVGNYSGTSNTDGGFNVYMGNNAGASNTTGNSNVFIGDAAGYSYSGSFGNIFIGQDAAKNVKAAQRCVMIGYSAGSEIDTIDTKYGNVFLGAVAGQKLKGDYNVAIGEGAGENYNLGSNGSSNIFIGKSSGRFSTGSENIYLGFQTGQGTFDDPHTGSRNIYLGSNAGWADRTESDRLRIGGLLWGKLNSNQLVVNGEDTDNPNGRTFFVNGDAGGAYAWYNDSDERQKKNIETIESPLDKVTNLRGVTYEWKDNSVEKGTKMGFIAQETVEVIPEVVDHNKETDHYTMQYAPITALLVEAVKELKNEFTQKLKLVADTSARIKKQDKRIDILIKENEKLKIKVSELEELRAEVELIKTKLTGYASK